MSQKEGVEKRKQLRWMIRGSCVFCRSSTIKIKLWGPDKVKTRTLIHYPLLRPHLHRHWKKNIRCKSKIWEIQQKTHLLEQSCSPSLPASEASGSVLPFGMLSSSIGTTSDMYTHTNPSSPSSSVARYESFADSLPSPESLGALPDSVASVSINDSSVKLCHKEQLEQPLTEKIGSNMPGVLRLHIQAVLGSRVFGEITNTACSRGSGKEEVVIY